jgi:hypothetical protein
MDKLKDEAEKAAVQGEQEKVYKITKIVCGKHKKKNPEKNPHTGGPRKGKQGTLLTTETEQEEKWAEHFCKVLNRPSPDETVVLAVDLDINTDPPTRDEIINAIKAPKNRK